MTPDDPLLLSDLRAQTYRLDDREVGLLRSLALARGLCLERDGLSVLGIGEAATVRLPNGLVDRAMLRQVKDSLELLGPFATAIGAFHFLPEAATSLTVPEVCVRVGEGAPPMAVVIGRAPTRDAVGALVHEAQSARSASGESDSPPDSFRLFSRRSHADFLDRVSEAVTEVRSGRLDKVVMAREVVIEANRPLRQNDLLERLRTLHPSCMTFAIHGFIGASPELLIRRAGDAVASHPLAGTAARSGDPAVDRRAQERLLSSHKERGEHRAVVDAIAAGLRPVTSRLQVPGEPSVVELRNVSHLGSHITAVLARDASSGLMTALDLLALIHPTPAVAGMPVDLALDYLAKAEDLERDRYGGAVGWTDGAGDGEWYLGIRSAIVDGRTARLFAGVGIVADSDPGEELAETQLKLQAFLAVAVRP
ncbi:MAG: isochorismate synthase [Acidimicrobiales bacterium]